ncbi:MAG: PDZ domain-containing protein, partial [Verrucomicrobiota bacterium]
MRPQPSVLDLEKQFVRLLVVNMQNVDVGTFDFDFDTTFAVLAMNSEKQVYLRYGGRDSKSAESFVSTASLERALTRSLELHESWKAGTLRLPEARPSRSARSYSFVSRIGGSRCVHCHDVASGKAIELFNQPDFNLLKDIWIYPEPASLGLHLDPDLGSTLRRVSGRGEEAGLKPGDRITSVEGKPSNTYTDLQYHLHQLPSDREAVELTLSDGRVVDLTLPDKWRYSDISWRRLGLRLSPSAGFGGSPLDSQRKKELRLPEGGLATEVSFIDFPRPEDSPLRQGDIVFSINGVQVDPVITHAALFLNLTTEVGETVELGVIRGGETRQISQTISLPPSSDRRIMDSDSKAARKKK